VLRLLPYTTVSLLSVEELNQDPAPRGGATGPSITSGDAHPSSPETLFLSQGRGVEPLSDLSQQFVDSAQTVNQQRRATTDLVGRLGA
jgi:hypothetical protein